MTSMKPLMGSLGIGVVAVLLSLTGAGCEHACGAVGCGSAATLTLTVPIAPTSSDAHHVTVCRNGDCLTAQLPVIPTDQGMRATIQFPGRSDPRGSVTASGASAVAIEIEWGFFGNIPNAQLHDGDHYTLDVAANGTNASVAGLDKVATYQRSYPNGPDCDPAPCLQVTLQGP